MRLIEAALAEKEILILLADHITTPKEVRFEVNVKKNVNSKLGRLALASSQPKGPLGFFVAYGKMRQ